MKNTLNFYNKIYEPLFQKNYNKRLHRAGVALDRFEKFTKKRNIKIKKVIDVGCSWAKTLKYWKIKGIKAYGVDVSQKIVNFCKNKGYKCYFASATDLSIFPDKKFDLYIAADVYEHLRTEDLDDAMEEALRITKKYLLIRPHPVIDRRKKLHLTIWSLDKWEDFFGKYRVKIIKIGKNNETAYKNVFLMEIK